jgi:hypothetical protein
MKSLSLAFGAVVFALSIAPDASLMAQRPAASPPDVQQGRRAHSVQ